MALEGTEGAAQQGIQSSMQALRAEARAGATCTWERIRRNATRLSRSSASLQAIGIADIPTQHRAFLLEAVKGFAAEPSNRKPQRAREFTRAGVRIASGPGVHGPSGNRFLYFYDPDGLTLELATLNERFVEGRERAARVLPDRPESFALDGVTRDPAMYTVGELEALD